MFFKVVTLTLVLLVQITYQGKLMSRRDLMHFFNKSNDNFGHVKIRNARHFGFMNKWLNNNHRIEGLRNSHHKTRFSEIMNFIISTPDYGLKYTEDHQPRRLDFPSFPGFHNLIEVRGPTLYRYIPNRLKEYTMTQIYKQNRYKIKSLHHITPELINLQPKSADQLDEVSFSREGFSIWENSHESYKRSSGSDLLKNMEEHSTPMQTFDVIRQYHAKAEVPPASSNSNVVPLRAPDVYEKIDPLPYKQVKTRNQEPESDEDEDDERSKYSEYY